jgi:monoamine oxidase
MHRSFRSPLTRMMREARAACRESEATGAPISEITAMRAERAHDRDRRRFLAGAAMAAVAAIAPGRSRAVGMPRIVIVGGGMAGLNCAYTLWKEQGIAAHIYEWNDRVGGRVQTLRGYFANGQTAEQHGDLISSEHAATLRLAQEFGLGLENTDKFPQDLNDTCWFADARYTQKALNEDWQDFGYRLFREAVRRAPNANYKNYSPDAYAWDHMSVAEWIDKYVPGGLSEPFGKMCYADVISEYGGAPEHQSALNLLYILGYDASEPSGYQPKNHPVVAGSDEKWHIAGGNDQLVTGIVERLTQGTIHLHHRLEALAENGDGSCTCTFARDGATIEVVADHVVLAIPFTTLRNVDLSKVSLSPLKRRAIETLPLGTNAKVMIQVAGSPWRADGYTGSMLTGAPLDGGWDGSAYQKTKHRGETSIYVLLPGSAQGAGLAKKYGLAFGHDAGPAPSALVAHSLEALEPVFPGVTAAWNAGPKLAWVNDGNIDRHLLGAWSQYNVGQYTGFSGIEPKPEGNIHFAGEQTSITFQGYIEGAVRSGARAAREIG